MSSSYQMLPEPGPHTLALAEREEVEVVAAEGTGTESGTLGSTL